MVGLALEGGGARGAAHVGVIRALEEEGLRPAALAGTSAGSIVAAAYAMHGSLEDAQMLLSEAARLGTRLLDLNLGGILRGTLHLLTRKNFQTDGIFKGEALYKWLDRFFRGAKVSDSALPLVIPAVDLLGGDVMAFSSGNPRWRSRYMWNLSATYAQAIRASCAIPIVFRPVPLGQTLLVDGGVLENLPVSALMALGIPKVLGVLIDVEEGKEEAPDDIVGIGLRTIDVMQRRLARFEESAATALLRVVLPEGSGLLAIDKVEEYALAGYRTARSVMPKLRKFFQETPHSPQIAAFRR